MSVAVGVLVSGGHVLSEIKRYTVRQVFCFVDLVSEAKKADMLMMLNSMRTAFHANREQFSKVLDELDD